MKILILTLNFITVFIKLLKPGGLRSIAAENIALRNQLIILTRHQRRSPALSVFDRVLYGVLTGMISSRRLSRIAIALKPATLLKFHRALVKRKYRLLFSNKSRKKPGPKGSDQTVINAILEIKKRNPRFGYLRIAMQINLAFGLDINKDIVRRVLNKHYRKTPSNNGPSWLTFFGHMKDSLWSIDLFRAESIHLKSHWVILVMDQFTRRIVGLKVHPGNVSGVDLCRLFNKIISGKHLPKRLSSDNDPLFTFHRWQANLRILDIEELKTVPYTPISHPFVERLIGTIRRELLDQTLFWNAHDLERKLNEFQHYYNQQRAHHGINDSAPEKMANTKQSSPINIDQYRWKNHCRGLFQLPVAA